MADSSRGVDPPRSRVGLVYDEKMCAHTTPDGEDHPECPDRIRAIWKKLQTAGVLDRCVILNAKKSDDVYNAINLVHCKKHVDLIRSVSDKGFDSKRKRIASKFNSIYFNKGSSEAAYLAAGSVIEAVERVASGDLNSAFAVVRPPGHHAEEGEPMGFCLYNNVALATSYILNNRPDLGIGKILIVDWDVHHGNGTQKMFWKDSRVLFFSVHRFVYVVDRHDNGTFYPANDDGSYNMIGEGTGTGYNINVPWEHGLCGDSDYLAVWDYVLIPVAKEFNPDLVIVSAGFDAAMHDPLGGCRITPYGYSVLLKKLMDFAHGKIVLALEGGYNLQSLANSALACVEVLLEGKPISGSAEEYAFDSTWRTIEAVRQVFKEYWPSLGNELPENMMSQTASAHQLLDLSSDSGSEKLEVSEDIIQSLSELKMNNQGQNDKTPSIWRKELKEIDVWYATYGSNMCKARFLCYIEGGQVEGMQRSCSGSADKTPPKETMWKAVSHRLFFGRDHTHTWGPGGVAFLHPESNAEDKAYVSMYRITLEQFNDILHKENISSYDMSSPLFDVKDLEHIRTNQSASLDAIKQGWYHNVVYLGEERGIPIITMTCELSDVENFKSGKVAQCAPPLEYANTLIRGLVEGEQLSETEARKYIEEAAGVDLTPMMCYHHMMNDAFVCANNTLSSRGEKT
ncbi:hypothetical protein V2J09_022479 [Rumex salicifolius]